MCCRLYNTKMPRGKRETCDLCCDSIQRDKDSLKCEGDCGCVVHRYCADVTKTYYEALPKSSTPFLCQYCSLKTTIAVTWQLQTEIESLKTELAAAKDRSTKQNALMPSAPSWSYAVVIATAANPQTGQRPQRTRAQQRKPAKPSTPSTSTYACDS